MTEDTPSTTSIVVRSVSETEEVGLARHARRASRAPWRERTAFGRGLWLHVREIESFCVTTHCFTLAFLDLAFDVDDDMGTKLGTESDK